MILIPAIDIKDGEAVRLYKGDYRQKKTYSKNPEQIAKKFEELGVKYIHIVDLDGAKDGKRVNSKTIQRIRKCVKIPIELGGGIRDEETVDFYLNKVKIDRIILGTTALKNPKFVKQMIEKYTNQRIVVGVDVKEGYVSVSGWTQSSTVEYIDFIKQLEIMGVKYIIATDISKDGTLNGPNFDMYKEIEKNSNLEFVVSGGVKDIADIKKVAEMNYYGCIVGKAYYEGKINIEEAMKCLEKG